MRVQVHNHLDDLARDMAKIPATMNRKAPGIVARNAKKGNTVAKGIARGRVGKHGKNYHKRLTAEAISPLTWEYGPHGQVVGNAVGGGWRNGPPNTDLEKSLDVVGPMFHKDVSGMVDGLFWPGA